MRAWGSLAGALLLLSSLVSARCAATSQEGDCLESARQRPYSPLIIVNPSSICAPEGIFIAVRKSDWSGVVRFIEQRDRDTDSLQGCSRYELYSLGDRKGPFERSAGVVSSSGSAGVHPIVIERGRQRISGRGIALRYMHPGCLSLLVDRGVEVAPTPWRTIDEVDVGDVRLQWYSLDASGNRRLTISLDELAGRFGAAQ